MGHLLNGLSDCGRGYMQIFKLDGAGHELSPKIGNGRPETCYEG